MLGVLVRATGRPLMPEPGERRGLILAGIFGYGTESALYFSALNHGSAAAVTLLFYTYPVIVMLVSIAIERRAPARLLIAALLLAVVGSAIVVVGGSQASTSSRSASCWRSRARPRTAATCWPPTGY